MREREREGVVYMGDGEHLPLPYRERERESFVDMGDGDHLPLPCFEEESVTAVVDVTSPQFLTRAKEGRPL